MAGPTTCCASTKVQASAALWGCRASGVVIQRRWCCWTASVASVRRAGGVDRSVGDQFYRGRRYYMENRRAQRARGGLSADGTQGSGHGHLGFWAVADDAAAATGGPEPAAKLAVIVNDLGELGLDHRDHLEACQIRRRCGDGADLWLCVLHALRSELVILLARWLGVGKVCRSR